MVITSNIPKFGTFSGVFLPTFLSIIGVILFLRLGVIVGTVGVFGTLLIIVLAASVTFSTGLSLSCITSNIRIGDGGVYSIITKALGLEVGGSVGIPLLLAQVLSISLYIFGFSEAWTYLFPDHPALAVVMVTFAVLAVLVFISTRLAIKMQTLVFLIIIAALISIFSTGFGTGEITVQMADSSSKDSFWPMFALFFPAVTGLMAGIGMSGELNNPKKQIPKGVITALLMTTIIYVVVAIWFGYSATASELLADKTIVIKLAMSGHIVLLGILASTFSSALSTFMAAPRLLFSMGVNSILPGSSWFAKRGASGIPQRAVILIAILIFFSLLVGNLDAIAPILTVFFLITYIMINIVVFMEQSMGLVSFRPTLKINKVIPLYGAIGSIIFIFLISAIAGLVSVMFLFISYFYLIKRHLKSKEGDIRSGLFLNFSEWAAKKILTLPESSKHIWKPNVLVPVTSTDLLLGNFSLIKSIIYPNGTMNVLGFDIQKKTGIPENMTISKKEAKKELKELPDLVTKFGHEGIFTSSSTVAVKDYTNGVCISLEAIEGQFFHPNILFLLFNPRHLQKDSMKRIFRVAKKHKVGVVVLDKNEEVGLGSMEDIHIWLPPETLKKDIYEDKIFDLAMLVGYRLSRNWTGNINLWMCVKKKDEVIAKNHMRKLVYEARFPQSTKIHISTKSFNDTMRSAPHGDIHLVPVSGFRHIAFMRRIARSHTKSFMFILDSSKEDVLA